jgi:hypothetical protein
MHSLSMRSMERRPIERYRYLSGAVRLLHTLLALPYQRERDLLFARSNMVL